MKTLGIIPARYASTRFQGKPLVDIMGKPMIQWVYESAVQAMDATIVATDDQRIVEVVESFGGRVIMTREDHTNGTSRVEEAYSNSKLEADIIVNIQGDEPMLAPDQLRDLVNCFEEGVDMATLSTSISDVNDLEGGSNVFVVCDHLGDALYFSRFPIPFVRDIERKKWLEYYSFKKHIGLYAFRPAALQKFVELEESALERAESLEQNRWLENGGKLRVGNTNFKIYSVDTPKDLERVLQKMKSLKK